MDEGVDCGPREGGEEAEIGGVSAVVEPSRGSLQEVLKVVAAI